MPPCTVVALFIKGTIDQAKAVACRYRARPLDDPPPENMRGGVVRIYVAVYEGPDAALLGRLLKNPLGKKPLSGDIIAYHVLKTGASNVT